MSKYILLTGATGLVGRYLIRDLQNAGHRLALVIRPSKKESIEERVESILQKWENELGTLLPRPVVFAGDVAEEGLGLDRTARRWISRNCDRVLHNAAILTFHGEDRSAEPWRTNLSGTQNTLELCRETGIRDLHYVSTAYVCGTRSGVIREDELNCGQSFRNDYEHSKLLAESLVRNADFLEQLTVYRPAVIAGDSTTGYTSTYHGLYMYLQLMSVLNRNTVPDANGIRHTNIRLNMTGDEPRNIVPVDWVSATICRLVSTPAAHGGTYHLSPIDPITPRQIIAAGYKYFNSCGVEFCGPQPEPDEPQNAIERATYENKSMYDDYELSDPTFDTTNLQKFCADIPCPPIDEAMLHRFLQFGEEDRWGKRKPPAISVPMWVGEQLANLASQPSNRRNGRVESSVVNLALDVCGPGGGQFHITLKGSHVIAIEPGLPRVCDVTLRLTANEFANLISGHGGFTASQIRASAEFANGVDVEESATALLNALLPQPSATCVVLAGGQADGFPLPHE